MLANALLRQSILRRLPNLFCQSLNKKNPITLAAALSSTFVKPINEKRSNGILSANKLNAFSIRATSTQISEKPPSFAGRYYWERVWMVGMLPLLPAALFIHNPVMDYALGVAVAMHIHWGLEAVIQDYARPFVIGETLAKLSHYAVYVFSILMFAGLLHFNYTDVGITKAFEMIWSL